MLLPTKRDDENIGCWTLPPIVMSNIDNLQCFLVKISGVNTDEIESSADDWDEVTIEILIDEEDTILSEEGKD